MFHKLLTHFLIKLRTGNSERCIAAILDIDEKQVQKTIEVVLQCFRKILPVHFGYQSHSRDFFISQIYSVPSKLYDLTNHLSITCDATYLRHQKSSNNVYQRKSYSGQKKTSACKPFTICTTIGYVINVDGPFNATKNDAKILEELLKSPNSF